MSNVLAVAAGLLALSACSNELQPESAKLNYLPHPAQGVDASLGSQSADGVTSTNSNGDGTTELGSTASLAAELGAQCSAFRDIVSRALVEQLIREDALAGAPLPGTEESKDFVPPDAKCADCTEESGCNSDESIECLPIRACIARHCLCSGCLEAANTDLCDCAERCFPEGASVCRTEWTRLVECQVDSCESVCAN